MRNILIVARKEVREGLRNRWVLATTLLLAALALTLSFLGSAPTGNVGVNQLDVVIVSLSSLTIFLVPLIALLLSHDAIVGEMERGTMLLLLSYPIGRNQVILGKFLGHLAILSFATLFGYGAAAVALAVTGTEIDATSWASFVSMLGSSVLLGAVFIAIGYLVSARVRERSTAGGISIGIWLLFVLIYDMALLGALVAAGGHALPAGLLDALLLLNPTDAYRMLNLGTGEASALSGMGGIAGHTGLNATILIAALCAWTIVPLVLAAATFSRRAMRRHYLTLALMVSALMVGGCEGEKNAAPPAPFALTSEAIGRYCGMNVLEHVGPKGQVILDAKVGEPLWFSSARDTLAFTMLPEEPKDYAAIYVSDMGKAPSWEEPGETNWIDAKKAFYVIGSALRGGMGAEEAVPFSTREAAEKFASENGGKVMSFGDVPRDYILGGGETEKPKESGAVSEQEDTKGHDHG